MATKRMLVDAIHPEETRIVVTSGNRLEEFDFESASRRQLRGNIYLAKVTRVEPSLQAAFIEYGGNRHGFLAFSEIHPDYYQIPVADREALLRDEEEDNSAAEAEADTQTDAAPHAGDDDHDGHDDHDGSNIEQAPANSEPVESIGGADALEEVPQPARRRQHRYKIQEVIKRRQVMLVQVVKEERGNKGAALTTYLSLAGRYSVLMPNTARGGGISRKITNAADRKRLKEITSDLEVPQGMGVILRTAGASRTKAEVKRDFEYLMRLWENVRNLTLRSSAPCLVYEEGSLIKRTIRDLYDKEIDEVFVAGEHAFNEARDFMHMIMPSHTKNVQLYTEDQPLFSKYNVEAQLDQMFSQQVTLPSGGYIVINPTEALVSIDVNSGRATKEHNIEDTALQTNLEAAEEVSRQLRLRDLAGLIVIDFIDMGENRNNRAVERKLKDCLKNDRARIQVGRISHFGLMEMSRQRIRFGVVESSTVCCPTCAGMGVIRSAESLGLMILRNIEDHVMRRPGQSINLKVPFEVALYILNLKRDTLTKLENKYSLSITVTADPNLTGNHFEIEKGEPRALPPVDLLSTQHVRVDTAIFAEDGDDEADIDETEDEDIETAEAAPTENGDSDTTRRRKRRRRRGGERGDEPGQRQPQQHRAVNVAPTDAIASPEGDDSEADAEVLATSDGESIESAEEGERKRRRRGRRGGRRNRRDELENGENAGPRPVAAVSEADVETIADSLPVNAEPFTDVPVHVPVEAEIAAPQAIEAGAVETIESVAALVDDEAPVVAEKPKRGRRTKKAIDADEAIDAEIATTPVVDATAEPKADEKPKRKPRARKPKAGTEADAEIAVAAPSGTEPAVTEVEAPSIAEEAIADAVAQADVPAEPELPRAVAAEAPAPVVQEPIATEVAEPVVEDKPRRVRKEFPAGEIMTSSSAPAAPEDAEGGDDADKKKKPGWWQRRLGLG